MGYEEEGSKSQFNAGVAFTMRIDSLQKAINAARYNPFAINPETMTYNWQVMISSLEGLHQEGRPKFSSEEKKACEKKFKILSDYVRFFPPISTNVSGRYSHPSLIINEDAWGKIQWLIDDIEKYLRYCYDKHNINSPNVDDDWGL